MISRNVCLVPLLPPCCLHLWRQISFHKDALRRTKPGRHLLQSQSPQSARRRAGDAETAARGVRPLQGICGFSPADTWLALPDGFVSPLRGKAHLIDNCLLLGCVWDRKATSPLPRNHSICRSSFCVEPQLPANKLTVLIYSH